MARSILEARLEGHFSDDYRRVMLDTAKGGTICLTLFPRDNSTYRIVTRRKFGDLSFESLCELISGLD